MSKRRKSDQIPAATYRVGETCSVWHLCSQAAAFLGVSVAALGAARRRAARDRDDEVVSWSDIEARRFGRTWRFRFGPSWRAR